MRFVHPQVLFFLFALVIPVVVHLLKLHRYRREYFSNVRMLEQIRQEQKRSSRLREILVLSARMLALACLVLAFAQPFIPRYSGQGAAGSRLRVGIYLDNSFSMQAPTRESVILEEAKSQVEKILQALPDGASVQFMTNRFSGREQSFRSVEEVREELRELDYCPVPRSFLSIAAFQKEAFDALSIPSRLRVFYYVSDFQKSVFSFPSDRRWADSQSRYVFVPIRGTAYSNLSIDSLSLDVPVLQAGREIGLRLVLTNHSGREQLQVPLRLYVQDRQIGVYPLDFKSGETRSVRIPFRLEKNGEYSAYVEIDDYPMRFDDRLYFSLSLMDRPKVLHLYREEPSPSLVRLFGRDSVFGYAARSLSALDYAQIPTSRLLVLDGIGDIPSALESVLARFVREGGSLAVFPPPVSGPDHGGFPSSPPDETETEPPLVSFTGELLGSSYGRLRKESRRIRQVDFAHPVFSLALDGEAGENLLPAVSAFYPLPESEKVPYRSLMSFSVRGIRPQEDFLRVYSVGKGLLYLFSTSPRSDNTDFASHYTFVVSLLNMALFQGEGPRLYHNLDAGQGIFFPSASVPRPGRADRYFLLDPRSGHFLMPLVRQIGAETAFFTYGQVGKAGNYLLGIASEGFSLPSFDSLRSEDRARVLLERGWKSLYPVSFNFGRTESEPECHTQEELQEWMRAMDGVHCFLTDPVKTDLSQSARQIGQGKELWKVFVIFALLFVLLETLFLRGLTKSKLLSGIPKKKE